MRWGGVPQLWNTCADLVALTDESFGNSKVSGPENVARVSESAAKQLSLACTIGWAVLSSQEEADQAQQGDICGDCDISDGMLSSQSPGVLLAVQRGMRKRSTFFAAQLYSNSQRLHPLGSHLRYWSCVLLEAPLLLLELRGSARAIRPTVLC